MSKAIRLRELFVAVIIGLSVAVVLDNSRSNAPAESQTMVQVDHQGIPELRGRSGPEAAL